MIAAEAVTPDAERKALSTLRARLALVGVVLRETEADNGGRRWIVTEGALTKHFGDLGELERWADLRCGRCAAHR